MKKIIMGLIKMLLSGLLLYIPLNGLAADKPPIFPIPQEMQRTGDFFTIDESITILVPAAASQNDLFLARSLVRELSNRYAVAVKIANTVKIPAAGRSVIMGRFDNPLVAQLCKANGLVVNSKNPGSEGYLMNVSSDRIIIAGSDDQGAFYGLQSLRQLIDAGNGKKVQGMAVRDWPAFPFRAVRLYVPGPDNIAFFKRFMSDFMALYKYNKVIIEMNCMRLDRHPEVNAGWIEFSKALQFSRSNSTEGIRGEEKNSSHFDAGDGYILEKSEIRDIVNYARENFLEVIPEIPSLTHGYWLLTRHPELAEYQGDRWPDTYCPSNPDSYKLMFDVYDEYIDVIKPKMIHIGHDEWWGAPLGSCPLCNGKDPSELFAGDVVKIHEYMSKKGIKVAMWGDYLLESVRNKGPQNRTSSTGVKYQTPGAVRPDVVTARIPKDILVFNWFWIDQEKEMELQKFGFKQIYGNFTPNISNWDERVKKIDLMGGAPSSWAATNEFNFGKDLILDFLGCANFVWSKHTLSQRDQMEIVHQLMPSVRTRLNITRIPSRVAGEQEFVSISPIFNAGTNPGFLNVDLTGMKEGRVGGNGIVFNLETSGTSSVVAVGTKGKGEVNLPSEIKGIQINEDVSSLIFLHACALPSTNQKAYFNIPDFFDTSDLLGWYEIVYEDNYRITVPVQYGVNILEWNPGGEDRLDKMEGETGAAQNVYAYNADPVMCSVASASKPVTFFAFEWINPRFGKKISVVNLFGTINYQATGTDYGKPAYSPLKSNAIMLAGITKIKKTLPYVPKSE